MLSLVLNKVFFWKAAEERERIELENDEQKFEAALSAEKNKLDVVPINTFDAGIKESDCFKAKGIIINIMFYYLLQFI